MNMHAGHGHVIRACIVHAYVVPELCTEPQASIKPVCALLWNWILPLWDWAWSSQLWLIPRFTCSWHCPAYLLLVSHCLFTCIGQNSPRVAMYTRCVTDVKVSNAPAAAFDHDYTPWRAEWKPWEWCLSSAPSNCKHDNLLQFL